jgi:flagellar motor switch protein FliM
VNIASAANEVDRGARKLKSAMLEHSNLAVERMPGLGYALNRFVAEAPLRLSSLFVRPSGGSIEEVRATTLFEAIEDCSGLTAALYASVEPEARILIALDERIDHLIVSAIFGEVVAADVPDKAVSEAHKPRTAIEAALIEAFARGLGEALEAAFAPLAPIALSFERLETLTDPFALGRRDSEAAAARFSLQMNGGACEGLVLLPQAFLMPFRNELAHDPEADAPAGDRRWSRLMEFGVQQTRLPVTAILEEVPMSLVARFNQFERF